MPGPTKQQVLRLYKHLIRYGNQLKLTDKDYFLGRIKKEFQGNKILADPERVDFAFKKGEALLRRSKVL